MKHIYENGITAVSANSENVNFPIENILDEHPKRPYKAKIYNPQIEFSAVHGVSDIMFSNTNIESVNVTGYDPNVIEWGDNDEWGGSGITEGETLVSNGTFDENIDGWTEGNSATLAFSGGALRVSSGASAYGYAYQQITTVAGCLYKLTFTGTIGTASAWGFGVGTSVGGSQLTGVIDKTETETTTIIFLATSTTTYLNFFCREAYKLSYFDDISVLYVGLDEWANTEIASITGSTEQNIGANSLWITLSETIDRPIILVLYTRAPIGTSCYVGCVRANIVKTYGHNPRYGVEESRIDYSIIKENSNGSMYYKKRDIVRTFAMNAMLTRTNAQALIDAYDSLGMEPSAWKMTDASGSDWVVFGRFADPPLITHMYPEHCEINWTIIEVL